MPLAVTTVTGSTNVEDLGPVLTHEHIHMQFDCALQKPPEGIDYPSKPESTFALQNLGVVRQFPYSSVYNTKLDDADTKAIIVDELIRYKNAGGGTIVENTVEGISRDLDLLKTLSLESGVKIVAGTGYYIACAQSNTILKHSVEEMHDVMVKELLVGNSNGVKCGIVGEIGSSWPIEDFERRAIEATAAVQQTTNKPITFHPGRNPKAPFEIMRIFMEAGGKPENVVMSHLDRTFYEDELLLEFAKLKVFTQFDLFGNELSYYQLQDSIDFLSDAQRIERIRLMRDNGHLHQVTISHDIHTKHRLVNFGGHGYGHILQNLVPKLKIRGFSPDEIKTIIVENPKRWLSQGADTI